MNELPNNVFKEEATELLLFLESSLLELEINPSDNQLIDKVFRAMHTIKGSSGMFGYENISSFTHSIENVFDKIRNGEISVDKKIIDLTLKAVDIISLMLNDEVSSQVLGNINTIKAEFKSIANPATENNTVESISQTTSEISSSVPFAPIEKYYITFKPAENIFFTGTNLLSLLDELNSLGEYTVDAIVTSIPLLTDINTEFCYTGWNIQLKTASPVEAIRDVFIFVEDICEVSIQKIPDRDVLNTGISNSIINSDQILNETGFNAKLKPLKVLPSESESLLNKNPSSTPQIITSHSKKDEHTSSTPQIITSHSKKDEHTSSIRVNSGKLDDLVNLVGELVTLQARLIGAANNLNNPELNSIAEETERITWSLRDGVLNLRMVPVSSVFNRFQRLVRDLCSELKKKVEFTIVGGETEMDKNMIDRLYDPLVHIIRNCIDHGIELPDERIKMNKNGTGLLQITAMHSGANVVIEIKDDGAGLNTKRILEKARQKGLIAPNADPQEEEVFRLILMPGFSTSESVTSISGRGVGMDVVKKAIEELKGSIDIKSRHSEGTVITLKLPLTLAIIEGLLVKIDEEHFIIPLSLVEECIELQSKNRSSARNLVNVRDELVPFISLREIFDIKTTPPIIEQIVIICDNNFRVGLAVDNVIGSHQTVIKSLGRFYRNVECISGATLLGEGTVALILDAGKIIGEAMRIENLILNKTDKS